MGDKPEVLEAVLKETVDLVMDLNAFLVCALWVFFYGFCVGFSSLFVCRRTFPLRKCVRI